MAVWDWDDDKDAILAFTVNGKKFAYSRTTALTALGLAAASAPAPVERLPSGFSQAQLGKRLWRLAKRLRPPEDQVIDGQRLTFSKAPDEYVLSVIANDLEELLSKFDGQVSKYRSEIPAMLDDLSDYDACRQVIEPFLDKYPSLRPKRKATKE